MVDIHQNKRVDYQMKHFYNGVYEGTVIENVGVWTGSTQRSREGKRGKQTTATEESAERSELREGERKGARSTPTGRKRTRQERKKNHK